MKLLHCADFHLDSPLTTNLPPERARQRKNELLMTFGRVADYAAAHDVRAVLIAGDLFDHRAASRRTAELVLDMVARCPSVDFLYLRGNHDAQVWEAHRALPANLRLFTDEWTRYDYGDVSVFGTEALDPDGYDTLRAAPDRFNIALLHGNAADSAGPGQIALPRLRGKGMDYLALGHLHAYHQERLDARGVWCYPGCPEGRGFDESGAKGFVLLDIAHGQAQTTFVPFALRTLQACSVDLTGAQTLPPQQGRVREAAAVYPPEDMLSVTLTGTCPPEAAPDVPFLTQELNRRYYFARVQDRTGLAVDTAQYQSELSLKGAFFRLVAQQRDLSEEDRHALLRMGFCALDGDELPQERAPGKEH